MATAKVTVTSLAGYTTSIGNRALGVKKISWDGGDYVPGAAGGLQIFRQSFGLRGIDTGWAGISADGLYIVQVQIPSAGAASARLRFYVATTGAEVAAVALTAGSVTVGLIGG